jgi:acyl carrier protein
VESKLILELPPKLKEYLDSHRTFYTDDNRGSLPAITDPDEPLHIDSLGLLRLVAFLENELGYRIEDDELSIENFATLRQLSQLLATKTPTGPTAEARLPGTVNQTINQKPL